MNETRPDSNRRLLKVDALGCVRLETDASERFVVRDTRAARRGLRWLARRLARREARALERLRGLVPVPELAAFDGAVLVRRYIAGTAMSTARPRTRRYYAEALRLLRRMHAAGIAHNDLAKEANWLCTPEGKPAVVDFQIAVLMPRRGRLFRLLAREDLRHMLKHKRYYASELLSERERAILATPSLPARVWRRLFKPAYHALTRGLLGWPERDGPEERQRLSGK